MKTVTYLLSTYCVPAFCYWWSPRESSGKIRWNPGDKVFLFLLCTVWFHLPVRGCVVGLEVPCRIRGPAQVPCLTPHFCGSPAVALPRTPRFKMAASGPVLRDCCAQQCNMEPAQHCCDRLGRKAPPASLQRPQKVAPLMACLGERVFWRSSSGASIL